MRAVVFTRFGPPEVLGLREVPRPSPSDGEVLIRIRATTVTSAETGMRQGRPMWGRVILGFTGPRRAMRTLGLEFAGEIEAVGAGVTRFVPGDRVFGFTGFKLGANAEYRCLPQAASLGAMPAGLSFEEAAAVVDGASTALYFLRDRAGVRSGQRVLVVGASGSIGMYAVQLAKHFGAHVTGVCSGANADLVRSLGADDVVDYTREEVTGRGGRYDVVFDTVGKLGYPAARRVLHRSGCYLPTTGLVNYWYAVMAAVTGAPRVRCGMSADKTRALPFLRDLIEAGGLRIVIDRTYRLDEIVEAHRYVDTGRKRGNVVVTV
ncbi:NAD(P)-dependent alcohol dehydrogenase [Catellatospora sp. KI3]|uniref:NAD(P)-dependent alcohol dehydrogenase n=1 Tax=Catellatospora sp. KI3 TaxID=3041620 RepID=UPI002482B7F9|nr:NAD(P)-dependent alcohol dehydrogenase [Catellatospora sp. KI3]MDI1464719.1 NAD(P)-dependent alcohol dehydrogenase [Catellatospora sp. KI3]